MVDMREVSSFRLLPSLSIYGGIVGTSPLTSVYLGTLRTGHQM